MALEADLRAAADDPSTAGFSLAFQPIVALQDGQVCGVETLMRWTHPTRGDVTPSTFIPVAESLGAIVSLGHWALTGACRQLADWQMEWYADGYAVDDFGTGYSSLSYLQKFPVDVLKIDRTFVETVDDGASDAALARAIVALGQSMSLRTVAEGIETVAQRDALLALGCMMGQGFLFARPQSAELVGAWMREHRTPNLVLLAG